MRTAKIKQIPEYERPREKLAQFGPAALSDLELLVILLGTGVQQSDVFVLSRQVLRLFDSEGLELSLASLEAISGIGRASASRLLAAGEFYRRRIQPNGSRIERPTDVQRLVTHLALQKQEHFVCISLNGAQELISSRVVSVGLVNQALVHPREVFSDAIVERASGIIIAHNHPAGVLEPSKRDIQVTKQLCKAGRLLGITLLDHIIFDEKDYYSFVENGLI